LPATLQLYDRIAQVPPFVALLACLAAGLILAVTAVRPLGRAAAAVPLALGAFFVVWVFSEDTYRRNGISRWDAYRSPGGALTGLFVVSVAVLAVACVALAVLRGRAYRLAATVAALAVLFVVVPTVLGFSLN
jgi:hypothetical protein